MEGDSANELTYAGYNCLPDCIVSRSTEDAILPDNMCEEL